MEDRLENNAFISAYFDGSLSDAERDEFEHWLAQNPSHQSKLDHYRLIWESSSKLLDEENTFEQRWETLSNEMGSLNSENVIHEESFGFPEQQVNTKKIYWYLRVAALLVIGITATLYSIVTFLSIETVAKPGTTAELELPDGSYITLNAATSLKYSKIDWWLGQRKVFLAGEAFFEVKKMNATFSVQTDFATTTVLGTSFNIYTRENKQVISCFSGSVKVAKNEDPGEQLMMGEGDMTCLDRTLDIHAGRLVRIDPSLEKPNWIDGEYYYKRTAIREVLDEIERRFNIDIVSDSDIGTLLFTGHIKSETPDDALEVITSSMGISWSKADGQKYVIE